MSYTIDQLDKISENDEEAFVPVSHPVYVSGLTGLVRIRGTSELLEFEDKDAASAALVRFLQRRVDTMKNSEAAVFLRENARARLASDPYLCVRIPHAVQYVATAEESLCEP